MCNGRTKIIKSKSVQNSSQKNLKKESKIINLLEKITKKIQKVDWPQGSVIFKGPNWSQEKKDIKNSKKIEEVQKPRKHDFSIILMGYDKNWLRKRLARRVQTLYIGRVSNQIKRTEKLISILAYNGKRKRIEDVIFDIKIRIKEAFRPISSADFLENLLIRLEPMVETREVKTVKRKHSNRNFKNRRSFIVIPATPTRRIRLALNFFIKAVHLNQRKFQYTLATAMMLEIVCIIYGLNSHTASLKKQHIKRARLFYNHFGTPVFEDSVQPRKLTKRKKHVKKYGYRRFFYKRSLKPYKRPFAQFIQSSFRKNYRQPLTNNWSVQSNKFKLSQTQNKNKNKSKTQISIKNDNKKFDFKINKNKKIKRYKNNSRNSNQNQFKDNKPKYN